MAPSNDDPPPAAGDRSPGALRLGTAGWAYKDWVGPFYPAGTSASAYLKQYARVFSAVEVDSSFYGCPRRTSVAAWERATPEGFVFCPKVPRAITHEKRLRDCGKEWEGFLASLEPLAVAGKLGPLVLQFDYTFEASAMPDLAAFLETCGTAPGAPRLAVEIRHRSWLNEEFYAMLEARRTALVLADLYTMPRLARSTADFVYIRWLGNRKQIPDDFSRARIRRDEELSWWRDQVKEFAGQGKDIFAFANNRYQGHGPATVRRFLELLNTD